MPTLEEALASFDPYAPTVKPQDKAVFMPAMARSAGGMVRGAGHLASALGAEGLGTVLQEYGSGVEKANPAQFGGMAGLKASPGGFLVETLGELVPTVAGMAIPGGLIGKGLTKVAPALSRGVATGVGMGAASTGMETGEILGQQMQETGQYNMGRALPFGLAAGALDAGVGVGGVVRRGLAGQLGRTAAKDVGLGVIGKQALKTAGAEGLQEGVQTGLEMEGTKEGGFTEKASTAKGVDELLTSIVKGFIGGGAFGGVQGGTEYVGRKRLEADVKKQMGEAEKVRAEEEQKAAEQQAVRDTATRAAAQFQRQPVGTNASLDLGPSTTWKMPGDTPAALAENAPELRKSATYKTVTKELSVLPPEAFDQVTKDGTYTLEGLMQKGLSQEDALPFAQAFSDAAFARNRAGARKAAPVVQTEGEFAAANPDYPTQQMGFDEAILDTTRAEPQVDNAAQIAPAGLSDQIQGFGPVPVENTWAPNPGGTQAYYTQQMQQLERARELAAGAATNAKTAEAKKRAQQNLSRLDAHLRTLREEGTIQPLATEQQIPLLDGVETVSQPTAQPRTPEELFVWAKGVKTLAEEQAKTATGERKVKLQKQAAEAAKYMTELATQNAKVPGQANLFGEKGGPGLDALASVGVAPKEVAKEPSPKQVKPVQPSQSKKVQPSEEAPAQDQGFDAAPAAENAAGARSADTRAPGTETQLTPAGKTARNGAPTNEEVARAKRNAKIALKKESHADAWEGMRDTSDPEYKHLSKQLQRVWADSKHTGEDFEHVAESHRKNTVSESASASVERRREALAGEAIDGGEEETYHRSSHPMPNQKLYDKAVKSGDLAGVQTLIRSHFKSNKAMQRILDWVESSVGDVKLVYVNEEMTNDYGHYVNGEYDPATHSIKVYPGGANPVVLAHELAHAAMERQLQEVANYKGPKTEAQLRKVKAYNDLKAQYEKFKTAMPNSEAYGLTNLSEFMAEVFSNVDFRAALQTQPKTSFFRGLMRSIANFLGFKSAEQKALEDIFSAAQILAYRNPGEVFMPTEWKTVYSRIELGAELREFMGKTFDNQTKMDIWGDKGKGVWSNAKVHVSKFLMGMSYGHNLNELFGWIPGVRDIFLTQRAQEALAKKLQDRQGFDAEMYLRWKKPNNQDHIHLWTGLTYASDFRLTQDQALAAVREVNPATHKSLLEDQKKLPKNQKLDGTNLQDTDESRRKFDAMVTHLKAIKWGEKPTRTPSSKNPANVLPKDGTTWSAQEWGEHFLRENREAAQRLYETSLLNVVFRLYKGNDQALEKLYKESTGFPEIERMFEAADNKTPRDLNEVDNIRRMRDQAMSHMYIHTHRKGDYFVSLIQPKESEGDSDKHVDFIRFESPYEAKKFAEALRAEKDIKEAGYVVAYGQTSDYTHQSAVAGMMQLSEQMNAHLEAMKEVEGLDQKHIDMTKDMIRQALYAMMPENSILKSYLHRKGTPGWKPDEQFEGYMQHQAQSNFHYANNRFLGKYDIGFAKIKSAIKDMEEPHRLDGMKLAQKNKDTTYADYLNKVTKGDPIATKRLLNELLLRHTGNFVNLETPIADRWRSFTYAWQLGLAPGYLLANLMQPIQIGLPILGARYGWKDSTKALMDGYKVAVDVMGVVVNGDKLLSNFFKPRTTEDIIEALQGKFDKRTLLALTHLLNSGKVDYTLAKEAGMLSQGQSLKSIQISRVVSSAAHYSEMLNRVAAGMAAYELETARSEDQEKAENAMIWAIDQTQLDYNRMNQSRYLGKNSPLGRYTPLVSVFMSFNIQVMELYARHIRTMIMKSKDFPGTPAEAAAAKKEAWMAFTGMLATTFTLAGAMGLPLASLAYSMASWAGGDDDEPWDFPMAMRQWATTAFGSTGGLAFTEGLPTIIGMNMSQRVGHQGLMPYSRLLTDHRTMQELPAEALVTNMSAPMATAMNLYTGMGKAINYMMDGDASGGDAIIKALPAALRGVGTAVYGYHDAAGQELPHEVTAWQTAMQVLGIAPRFRNDQMMLLMSDKSKEATLAKRAQYIRKGLAFATQEDNAKSIQHFTEMSNAFVEANPRFASRMSIAPLLKKMSSDRAFYQMTGMGSTVPMNRLEEVYGLAQFLDLPED